MSRTFPAQRASSIVHATLLLALAGCGSGHIDAHDGEIEHEDAGRSSADGAASDDDDASRPGDDGDGGSASDAGDRDDDGGAPNGGVIANDCKLPNVLKGEALAALRTGDALKASSSDTLLDATLATLEAQRTQYDADLVQLFGLNADGSAKDGSLNAISWDPRHDSAQFGASFGSNVEALVSNDAANAASAMKARALAILGRTQDDPATRYLALTTNPFRTDPKRDNASVVNPQLDTFMENALRWLTDGKAASGLRLVLAQLDESTWFADESSTRSWLTAHLGAGLSLNVADGCDGDALRGCIDAKPDLLVVSQYYDEAKQNPSAIADAVGTALKLGVPVLYLQHDGGLNELGERLLALLQISHLADNSGDKLRISTLNGATMLGRIPANYVAIKEMLTRLKSGQYDFTPATAQSSDAQKALLASQFGDGANAVKAMMNGYDQNANDIFDRCGNELPKLLALLGDRLRQDIDYPMKLTSTSAQTYLRAYYADHAVYNVRAHSPAQPNRGSFDRKDLGKIVGVSKTVELVSRRDFRSAGVYNLPGQAMTVTRTDKSAVKTWIFVNSLRSGSTHEWDDGYANGYARPKFLQSAQVPLRPGESITLTNPYGGPVQVRFDVGDLPITLRFDHVGEHPHWRGAMDDQSFADKYAAGLYDWVEIATDGFELHSKADKFANTMKDARWNSPVKLAAVVEQYTFDHTHVLAGFQGRGVDKEPEVYDWATQRGFSVPTIDMVKHANMDQATCGNGCSGNPYDADWSFSPIGHGDLHELGHSLQNGRFQLTHDTYQYANHSVTNWSPFYGAARYFDDHGGEGGGWGVNHKNIFNQLQAAFKTGERAGTFSTHMNTYFSGILEEGGDSGITDNYSFFLQAMLMARAKDKLKNGYHVVPRIHLIDGAFRAALKSADTWTAQRATLGFGTVSFEQAKAISNNDFIAIAMSFATGLDYRDFFALWGLKLSAVADTQIASFAYPAVERAFFALGTTDHTRGALSTRIGTFQKITLDGTTAWPLP